MALVPQSVSTIRFLKGIPFVADYFHIRRFNNSNEQLAWFNQKTPVYEMNYASFQRSEKGSYIRASVSVDKLYNVNYVHFVNPDLGNKPFFGFVTHLEYVNKQTTNVYIEIDVWQTWCFDITFKESYIEREHQVTHHSTGKPYLNTQVEGLNYGLEYDIVDSKTLYPSKFVFLVIITSKIIGYKSIAADEQYIANGTVAGSPSPLYTYVLPIKRSDMTVPSKIQGTPTMLLERIMNSFASDPEIVNVIQSMYLTEYCGLVLDETDMNNPKIMTSAFTIAYVKKEDTSFPLIYLNTPLLSLPPRIMVYPDIFKGLDNRLETKLLTFPYTIIEVTDFRGNQIVLKPEYIDGDDLEIKVRGSLSTSNKVAYTIENYNKARGKINTLNQALINSDPNEVPIVTDYLAAFIQGNRNAIEARQNIADIEGVVSGGNGVLQGLLNMAGGGITGNLGMTIGGAGQAVTSAINGFVHPYTTAMAINAQMADASNIPPSIDNMGGNASFDFANGYTGITITRKQIKKEYQDTLSHFFNVYGLKVNTVKKPNIVTRKYWNFVKTVEANIFGDLNQADLQILKNMFNRGVTIWHTDDIGNYTLRNEVR